MTPVWIDMDAGFDDMLAVDMLARSSQREVIGMSLVGGNAPLPVVVENVRRMADFLGWRMPIHIGRANAIIGPNVTARNVLGANALPTIGRPLPDARRPLGFGADGVGAMIAALSSSAAPLTLLAIGPLTNVAIALLARPDLVNRLERLIWMGGSADRGNHTAAAEFNAAADPEAAAIVLRLGAPMGLVGLDCCRQVTVTGDDVAALRQRGGERADVLADLLAGYVAIASADLSRPMALYDPVAAAAIIDAASVAFAPAHVAVECAGGETRGMTVCEWRPRRRAPNAEVARNADAARVRCIALDALVAAAEG